MISRRGLIAAALGLVLVTTISTSLFATELEEVFSKQLEFSRQRGLGNCLLYYRIQRPDGTFCIESMESKWLNECDLEVIHDPN